MPFFPFQAFKGLKIFYESKYYRRIYLLSAFYSIYNILYFYHENFNWLYFYDVLINYFFILFLFLGLAVHRYIFIVSSFFIFLLTAILSFFHTIYHIHLTMPILQATLNTNWMEVSSFFSIKSFVWVGTSLAVWFIIVWPFFCTKTKKTIFFPSVKIGIVVALLTLPFPLKYRTFATMLNSGYSIFFQAERIISSYTVNAVLSKLSPTREIHQFFDYHGSDQLLITLVIGETMRGDHFSLNNYTRKTTPHLEKEDIINFGIAESCDNSTIGSLFCILTRSDHESSFFDRVPEESLFSIFNYFDYLTAVIGNTLYDENPMLFHLFDRAKLKLSHGKGLDEFTLKLFHRVVNQSNSKAFIVIETRAGHFPYHNGYTSDYKKFQPICDRRVISDCKIEEVINDYDNAVLYVDNFLVNLIWELKSKKQPSLIIYTSDHGEALGENGYYFHGHDNSPLVYNTPLWVWVSKEFKRINPEKYKNLLKNSELHKNQLNHDIIFHSILDIAGFDSELIDKSLSIFQKELIPRKWKYLKRESHI